MNIFRHVVLAVAFLLFFLVGCADNPLAYEEAEESLVAGKSESFSEVESFSEYDPLGYARGSFTFKHMLAGLELLPPGALQGEVRFFAEEYRKDPRWNGRGWLQYNGETAQGTEGFRARVRAFEMIGQHGALFAGRIIEGPESMVGSWVYVYVEDLTFAEGDRFMYRIESTPTADVKPGEGAWIAFTITEGNITCGWH